MYALNVLLLPVSLAGVIGSLVQALTGRRTAFARTPKVTGRTAAPAGYVAAEITLLLLWLLGAARDIYTRRWLNAAFAFADAMFLLYAVIRFVGIRAAWEDLRPLTEGFHRRCRRVRGRPRAPQRSATSTARPDCMLTVTASVNSM